MPNLFFSTFTIMSSVFTIHRASGRRVRPRTGRRRKDFSRTRFESNNVAEEDVEIIQPESTSGSRSRSTGQRQQRYRSPQRFKNRYSSRYKQQQQQSNLKEINSDRDLEVDASSLQIEEVSRFGGRKRVSSRYRNRYSSGSSRRKEITTSAPSRGSSSFKLRRPDNEYKSNNNHNSETTVKPKLTFKKFNRFNRPEARLSLLQKILNKGKNKNTLSVEEQQKLKETSETKDIEIVDENQLQNLGSSSVKDEDLQTTLLVSTVYPEGWEPSTFLEVATIRSPYSFNVDEGKSTRYLKKIANVYKHNLLTFCTFLMQVHHGYQDIYKQY